MDGKTVNKQEIAALYNVHPRSIQRDIKDITDFLERDELNTGVFNSVIYDKNADGYRLQYENIYKLSPQQILANMQNSLRIAEPLSKKKCQKSLISSSTPLSIKTTSRK